MKNRKILINKENSIILTLNPIYQSLMINLNPKISY